MERPTDSQSARSRFAPRLSRLTTGPVPFV